MGDADERCASVVSREAELPEAGRQFKVRIDPLTSHDSYGAWREGAHDDVTLACAVACWWAERMAAQAGDYGPLAMAIPTP